MEKKGFFVDNSSKLIYINKQKSIDGKKITIRTSPRFRTYKEAFAEYENLLNKKILLSNLENQKYNKLLKDVVEVYLNDIRLTKCGNTILSIKKSLKYILDLYSDISIKTLVSNTDYFIKLRNTIISENDSNANTKNLRFAQILNFFKRIKKFGYLSGEELDNIEIYFDKISNKKCQKKKTNRVLFFDHSTFEKMISTLNKDDKYYVLFLFDYYTGLRHGELCGLTWKNVNFEKNTIVVDNQIAKNEYSKDEESSLKTEKSYREISVPNNIMMLLKDYKKYSNSKYVFDWLNSNTSSINNVIKRMTEKAGIDKTYTIHCFRHSHASHLYSLGANIKYISNRLGHKDTSITLNIYVDLFKEKEQEIDELLNNSISYAI